MEKMWSSLGQEEKERLNAAALELKRYRASGQPPKGGFGPYLELGTRVKVLAEAAIAYHADGLRLVYRLPHLARGFVVGVRFWREGRYHAGSSGSGFDGDESEPASLDPWRTIPVYVVAVSLFNKALHARLEDVVRDEEPARRAWPASATATDGDGLDRELETEFIKAKTGGLHAYVVELRGVGKLAGGRSSTTVYAKDAAEATAKVEGQHDPTEEVVYDVCLDTYKGWPCPKNSCPCKVCFSDYLPMRLPRD